MVLFATNIFIVRSAMQRLAIDPGFIVLMTVNTLLAALILLASLTWRDAPVTLEWRALGFFALSGVFGIFIARRLLLETVRTLGPSRASVAHTATPVFTLAGAWALAGERLGLFELGIIVIVIAGLWLAQSSQTHKTAASMAPLGLQAIVMATLPAIGFGVGNVFRGLGMHISHDAILATIVGSATALACQVLSQRRLLAILGTLRNADRRGLALYAASGVATMFGSMTGNAAMNYLEISIAMLITYTTPIVVFPVSIFVLKNAEALTLRALIGTLIVLCGVAVIAFR